jgi:ribosomal protein L13
MSNHIHILLRGALSDCLRLMRKLMFRLAVYAGKRNPFKARVASPISYEWNSADVMFNPHAESVHGKSV